MLTKIEKAKIEQSLFKNQMEMDAYVNCDFTNIHDLNARIGKILNALDREGKISFSYKDNFKFSKEVSRLAWNWSPENKPSGNCQDLRLTAEYFAILADAFDVLEKQTEGATNGPRD